MDWDALASRVLDSDVFEPDFVTALSFEDDGCGAVAVLGAFSLVEAAGAVGTVDGPFAVSGAVAAVRACN